MNAASNSDFVAGTNLQPVPSAAAPQPPCKVLVKEPNWLGDVVMSLPALRAVRRAIPQGRLAVLIKKELASLFDGAQWIDEVIPYSISPGARGLSDRLRLISGLRARKFDFAVLIPNSFESALWVALAGIPCRAGYATDWRGPLLTHRVPMEAKVLSGHQARYWLEIVRVTLGVGGDPDDFSLEYSEPHLEAMRARLQALRRENDAKLVALAPAAAFGPAKEWPPARYAELSDLLFERFAARSVLVGAPNERARCEAVARLTRNGTLMMAGETNAGELAALLSLCDGFAGNDSGSMHLAAAVGLPTVGIFGSTDPTRTGPLGRSAKVIYHQLPCSPCLARTCRFGHYRCLDMISAEEVAEALKNLGAFN
jgi:heptosyltransferase II